ncbi:hypothetical protein B0T11DRAFT_274339 [Plectosphaerella cucumerina]|uniref:Uncharacterized protein n=1 Tax=Plectosphaerella cucumerina TaxID=40658 RepID=A0A8K0TPF1_9PEZI|nr:hypothetical protein B0T11DRAFT_274339 [Plectosphaerella cucumerina]
MCALSAAARSGMCHGRGRTRCRYPRRYAAARRSPPAATRTGAGRPALRDRRATVSQRYTSQGRADLEAGCLVCGLEKRGGRRLGSWPIFGVAWGCHCRKVSYCHAPPEDALNLYFDLVWDLFRGYCYSLPRVGIAHVTCRRLTEVLLMLFGGQVCQAHQQTQHVEEHRRHCPDFALAPEVCGVSRRLR